MTLTVQHVMDWLMEPVDRLEHTVDTLQFGSPDAPVTGIVTTFLATQEVIEQAIALKANLILTHEGAFYSHHERTGLLEEDPVHQEKLRLIKSSGIALFRLHDYIHRYQPDEITTGLTQALGWSAYVDEHQPKVTVLTVPEMTVRQAAEHVKAALGIPFVRVTGSLDMTCSRVGLLAGYRGNGATAIPLFEQERLELIVAGEGPEWETPEYVKDAVHQGKQRALILLGHAESEEPGMEALAERMSGAFPSVPVHFIPAVRTFQVL